MIELSAEIEKQTAYPTWATRRGTCETCGVLGDELVAHRYLDLATRKDVWSYESRDHQDPQARRVVRPPTRRSPRQPPVCRARDIPRPNRRRPRRLGVGAAGHRPRNHLAHRTAGGLG